MRSSTPAAAWVARNPLVGEALGPDAALMIGAPIAGPIVEEVTKGLGLVVLFALLRAEFDNMRDGFVYGALIGLGFNWFEAPLYVAQTYAEFGKPDWGMQLGWRYALFGFAGHAMFTGLFGASLGLALQTRRLWLKIVAPIAGLALAVAAHAYNNVLPLIFAIAARAAGEPPPQAAEPPPDIGLVEAWLTGSLAQLTLFLPFVILLGGDPLAQRRVGAPRDPRGARRRGRAQREPGGIRRHRARSVPSAPAASTRCTRGTLRRW